MTFAVEPADMDTYIAELTTLAGEAAVASSYLSDHVSGTGVATGIFAHVDGLMSDLVTELSPNYTTLQSLTNDAVTELTAAARAYRTTDTDNAAALDATY